MAWPSAPLPFLNVRLADGLSDDWPWPDGWKEEEEGAALEGMGGTCLPLT